MLKISTLSELDDLSKKLGKACTLKRETAPNDIKFFGMYWRAESVRDLVERSNQCYRECGVPEKVEITPEIASFLVNDHEEHLERTNKVTTEELKNYGGLYKEYFLSWITGPNIYGISKKISKINQLQKEYNRLLDCRDHICWVILSEYLLKQEEEKYFLEFSWHHIFYFSHGKTEARYTRGVHSSVDRFSLPKVPPKQ